MSTTTSSSATPGLSLVAKAIDAPASVVTAITEYEDNLARWADWYSCKRKTTLLELNDGSHARELRTLGMPKRVCEDWASLLWTENASVICGDETGDDILAALFGDTESTRLASHVERTFASGTGGMDLLIRGMTLDAAGNVTGAESMVVDYTPANRIIPLTWDARGITSAAFVSFPEPGVVDVRAHGWLDGRPLITNRRFSYNGNLTEIAVADGIAPELILLEGAPALFACWSPASVNNSVVDSPYGLSIFANAEDALAVADLVFDNFGEDFELGGKMLLIPDTMLRRDEAGNMRPPSWDKRNLFVTVEDPTGGGISGDTAGVKEFNPTLRVAENTAALESALGLISVAVGMGAERYRYRGETIATATQIISENSDLFRNRRKHLLAFSSALTSIATSALWCASTFFGASLSPDIDVTVRADDSVIEDDNSRIDRGLRLMQQGAISKRRFLTEYMGMAADEVAAELAEMDAGTPLFE